MKLLVLDGNSLVNRAFFGIKVLTTKDGRYTNAIYGFQNILLNLLSAHKPDAVAIAWDEKAPTFRHNAYDDIGNQYKVGLVAFRLVDLPDTEGQTVKLTLKWKSYGGDKSVTFDYCTRQTTVPGGEAIAAERSTLKMK